MIGQKNKELLCKLVKFKCEECKKIFKLEELEIHRIRRGNVGGTYEHRNCKVVCGDCHKLYHGNEQGIQGR